MADQLNMGGLSLDSRQPNGVGPRAAYIPPHLRNSQPQEALDSRPPPPAMMNGSAQPNGAWGGPHK